MKYIEKIKEMLCTELEVYSKKNAITPTDLERIHKLTDTIKNLDKIVMLEEDSYSEDTDFMGEGRMYGTSYARGRRGNVKRDRMGRYSRDDGMHYDYDDDYSERRMGRGYSRGDATDHMMKQLGEMMEDADPKEREALKECMRALERM